MKCSLIAAFLRCSIPNCARSVQNLQISVNALHSVPIRLIGEKNLLT
jgi:hypothetical protein